MKTYGGEWTASRLGRFTPGKDPRYTFDMLGGPQSRFGRGGKEKMSLPCPFW